MENYTLLKRCLENENVSSSQDSNFENPLPQDAYSPHRQKRSLPTTVTPDRCSSKKRDKTNKTPNRICKKQLYGDTGMQLMDLDDEVVNNCTNLCQHANPVDIYENTPSLSTENTSWTMNDLIANQCNIDPLISSNKRGTDVHVLIVYPNLKVARWSK